MTMEHLTGDTHVSMCVQKEINTGVQLLLAGSCDQSQCVPLKNFKYCEVPPRVPWHTVWKPYH